MMSLFRSLRAPLAAAALALASPGVASAWEGNRVQVVQQGDNHAATIVQNGDGNLAAMRQFGRNQTGTIVQSGDGNTACLIQAGRQQTAAIVQSGGERVALVQRGRMTREIPLDRCLRFVNGEFPYGGVRRR